MKISDDISREVKKDEERYDKLILSLTVYMTVIAVFYFFLNIIYQFKAPWYIFLFLALTGILSHYLYKIKRVLLAKVFGLTSFNVIIYLVSSSESPLTNVGLYFATAGIAALVLFNRNEQIKAYCFIGFSLILYLLGRYLPYSPLPYRTFSEVQMNIVSIVNMVAFAGVSAYLIILLLNANARHKKSLSRQNAELVKINRDLDKFIYSSSHDLRAPLSSLLGLIYLAEIEKEEATRQEYFQMMRKRISTMDLFIHDLIDYSKNLRQDVEHKATVIAKLIEEVIEDLIYLDGARELSISINILEGVIVDCDPTRLRVIFSNLISNAIKYRDPSKQQSTLIIKGSILNDELRIEFRDNGIGIPKEHIGKIFNMFFRAHDISIGSGLGLYIVEETVKTLQGNINVSSEVGIGSTFILTIPGVVKPPSS